MICKSDSYRRYIDRRLPLRYISPADVWCTLIETCFWLHLVYSIKGQTDKTWLSFAWFKAWVLGSLFGIGSLFGAVVPFRQDVQQMETVCCLVIRRITCQQLNRLMSNLDPEHIFRRNYLQHTVSRSSGKRERMY